MPTTSTEKRVTRSMSSAKRPLTRSMTRGKAKGVALAHLRPRRQSAKKRKSSASRSARSTRTEAKHSAQARANEARAAKRSSKVKTKRWGYGTVGRLFTFLRSPMRASTTRTEQSETRVDPGGGGAKPDADASESSTVGSSRSASLFSGTFAFGSSDMHFSVGTS